MSLHIDLSTLADQSMDRGPIETMNSSLWEELAVQFHNDSSADTIIIGPGHPLYDGRILNHEELLENRQRVNGITRITYASHSSNGSSYSSVGLRTPNNSLASITDSESYNSADSEVSFIFNYKL